MITHTDACKKRYEDLSNHSHGEHDFVESIYRCSCEGLLIDKKEAKDLITFLYDNGYISYEKHLAIHHLLKRLEEFLKESK